MNYSWQRASLMPATGSCYCADHALAVSIHLVEHLSDCLVSDAEVGVAGGRENGQRDVCACRSGNLHFSHTADVFCCPQPCQKDASFPR